MQLFNGLILGSIYVLLSLGLSTIFGMLGIINFALPVRYFYFAAFIGYLLSILCFSLLA
jgi:branched-chain amino acid transport system permease protein